MIYNAAASPGQTISAESGDFSEPTIGLVANIRPVKRIGDAIEAFSIVARRHPSATLEIVGGGGRDQLERRVAELGLSDRVLFLGQRPDVSALLRRYQICLLTSESEGLSNAIIEYMLAGVPVVCTNAGGNPELIEHGRNGFLYEVGDVESLAESICSLIGDASMRETFGSEGRRRAETMFAKTKMIGEHERLFRSLLPESPVDRNKRSSEVDVI